jgi:hypothetical protein
MSGRTRCPTARIGARSPRGIVARVGNDPGAALTDAAATGRRLAGDGAAAGRRLAATGRRLGDDLAEPADTNSGQRTHLELDATVALVVHDSGIANLGDREEREPQRGGAKPIPSVSSASPIVAEAGSGEVDGAHV